MYNSMVYYTGEFGQVYKAYLDTAVGTEIVAVKTVKGMVNDQCCIFQLSF